MATQAKVINDQRAEGQSVQPTMQIEPENTALVVTDPQIDFLSPAEVVWGLVGKRKLARNSARTWEPATFSPGWWRSTKRWPGWWDRF